MPRPRRDALRPLVFSTIASPEIRRVVDSAIALHLDCFGIFFSPIEGGAWASPLLPPLDFLTVQTHYGPLSTHRGNAVCAGI